MKILRPAPEVDKPTYEIVGPVTRFDERDQPTAREVMLPGSPEYEEYYSRHPELKEWDEESRRIVKESRKRNYEKDPVNELLGLSAHYGRVIMSLGQFVDGSYMTPFQKVRLGAERKKLDVDPVEMAKKIKAYGAYLGAAKVRIAKFKQEWAVSNHAYPYSIEQPYGKPVELDYPHIICMAVKQDLSMLKNGRGLAEHIEVHWTYTFASLLSNTMARFINLLGWRARGLPTENSPYLVVPAFVDAGIGEQGRCSFVVTKEFGSNFRPAAVLTDMPLALDKPVDFGLQDFCEKCMLCAEVCPSGAITKGGREVIRGVKRWPLEGDKCRRFWAVNGRDCGICQAVCCWNHPNGLLHDTVREIAQRVPVSRKFFVMGEKLIYGKYKPTPPPWWLTTKGLRESSPATKTESDTGTKEPVAADKDSSTAKTGS